MEFGVFSSTSVPRPWTEGKEAALIRQEVDMAVAAEQAGFRYYWAPEHHFLEEYSHCSASDTMCLAVGMRTTTMRLATGIFNICPAINHPIRVAERAAMVDILTNGRLELGTGRGSGSWEVNGFGLSTDETREMWDEAIHAIPKMWTQERFSWQGKHFTVPERVILPKPMQKPHPPLWVTASNPDTAVVAGQRGIGLSVFSFGDPSRLSEVFESYHRAFDGADPVGAPNRKTMTIAGLMCLEDGDEARSIYYQNYQDRGPYFARFFDTVRALQQPPAAAEAGGLMGFGEVESQAPKHMRPAAGGHPTRQELIERGTCVGDPAEVIEAIKRYEATGVDQLVLVPITGFHEPFNKTLESIATFGKHVLPYFAARPAGAKT